MRRRTLRPALRAADARLQALVRPGIDRPTPVWAVDRKTFWDRIQDDRELIGLKVVLLVSLLALTALLEWVA